MAFFIYTTRNTLLFSTEKNNSCESDYIDPHRRPITPEFTFKHN